MARICWGGSINCFIYGLASHVISEKKHCVAKVLLAMSAIFLTENKCNYNY